MTIQVKYQSPIYKMDEDGYFRCIHDKVEVSSPCCSRTNGYIDCSCYGQYSVYCWDCGNQDLLDNEFNMFLETYVEGGNE